MELFHVARSRSVSGGVGGRVGGISHLPLNNMAFLLLEQCIFGDFLTGNSKPSLILVLSQCNFCFFLLFTPVNLFLSTSFLHFQTLEKNHFQDNI